MDPQDLLYTNVFLTNNTLSQKEIETKVKYDYQLNSYFNENNKQDTEIYIERDNHEDDPINIKRRQAKPYPIGKKSNHYPLFDTGIKDIVSESYEKEIITKVSIDSSYRDKAKYFNTNSFEMDLPKVFNNVTKIVLNDVVIKNIFQSVSNYNNAIAWQYATSNYLIENNIDNKIVPYPNPYKPIYYSTLPNAVYTNIDNINRVENNLLYQVDCRAGFYSVVEFCDQFIQATNRVIHGKPYIKEYENTVIEEPYYSTPELRGTPHLFCIDILPHINKVYIANRMEEIQVTAIQTFSPFEDNFTKNDIFYNYTNQTEYNMDTTYIYVTIPFVNGISSTESTINPFPWIIDKLYGSCGNIKFQYLNYTPFFDLGIYTRNNLYDESELDSISTYKLWDIITIQSVQYYRYAFKLSNGNLNADLYNPRSYVIKPTITDNVILDEALRQYFYTSGIFNYNYIISIARMGRALPFRWIYDIENGEYVNYEVLTDNEKKRHLLTVLSWPISNKTNGNIYLNVIKGFEFVHINLKAYNVDALLTNENNVVQNTGSFQKLNIQVQDNTYYLVSANYIFIKIYFISISETLDTNSVLQSYTDYDIQYEQNYILSRYMNVGIGDDYNCLNPLLLSKINIYKKNRDSIFAKILLSEIPGNLSIVASNINYNNTYTIYYEKPLDKFDSVKIELYDSSLRLIETLDDYSFSMNVHELNDVLKETLVNSKKNNVNITGNIYNRVNS